MKKYSLVSLLVILSLVNAAQETVWKQLDGPEGGNVTYLGETANHTLIATDYYQQRLWTLQSGKNKWVKKKSEGIQIQTVLGMDGNRIYAAGYEPDSNIQYSRKHNIYYSENAGDSWTASGLGKTTRKLWVSPGKTLFTLTTDTLYRSMDDATTWEPVYVLAEEEYDWNFRLAIDSSENLYYTHQSGMKVSRDLGNSWLDISFESYAFLSEVKFTKEAMFCLSTSARNGLLYRSLDEGMTWQSMEMPMRSEIIQIESHRSGALFAWGYHALYRSDDLGVTWTSLMSLNEESISSTRFSRDNSLFVFSDDGWGNVQVYHSSDLGNQWLEQGAISDHIHQFVLDSEGYLYALTYQNGMYRSLDQGRTWNPFNRGFENVALEKLVIDDAGHFYAADFGNLYTSKNHGQSWEKIDTLNFRNLARSDNGTLYLMEGDYQNARVLYSKDHGATWQPIKWEFEEIPYPGLMVSGNNLLTLTVPGNNWEEVLFQTRDDGQNWEIMSPNVSDGDYSVIQAFHETPSGNYLISVYDSYDWSNTCYLSKDLGRSWTELDDGGLDFLNIDQGVLMHDHSSFFFGSSSQLSLSKDEGVTWDSLESGYESWDGANGEMRKYFFDQLNQSILALSGDTLMFKQDIEEEWQILNLDPINSEIENLSFDKNGFLYAHTRANELYQARLLPLVLQEAYALHTEVRTYPNPLTEWARISYTLDNIAYVSIGIYNLSGHEIRQFTKIPGDVGTHEVVWDRTDESGARVPSGIYIYRLKTNDQVHSGRMIVK